MRPQVQQQQNQSVPFFSPEVRQMPVNQAQKGRESVDRAVSNEDVFYSFRKAEEECNGKSPLHNNDSNVFISRIKEQVANTYSGTTNENCSLDKVNETF